VGVTIWRVTMARGIAQQAGMNPNTATAVTLLGNEGLDAAYLAANLRNRPAAPTSPDSPAPRTTSERLAELQRLKDQGLVTDEEYDAHRKDILGSV
jgi:Short C-terminal domain